MKNFIAPLFLVSILATSISVANEVSNYDDCILKYLQGVTSDLATKKISASCAAKYANKWEAAGTVSGVSRSTKDNGNMAPYGCSVVSTDGKYCADRVTVIVNVKETDEYVYRFKRSSGCPSIQIASGPKGWMHVESCSISNNRKRFTASVIGWTLPQTFRASLATERKRK